VVREVRNKGWRSDLVDAGKVLAWFVIYITEVFYLALLSLCSLG
jgi:hypothetical protein